MDGSVDELLQFVVCLFEYDNSARKPCIGRCGHSICQICATDKRCRTCPICRDADSFKQFIINFGLMNIIERNDNNKKKKIQNELDEKQSDMKCSFCKNKCKHVGICVDCSIRDGILIRDCSSSNKDELSFNTLHHSLAACIKLAKSSAICGDCVLDGKHYGHSIKSLNLLLQSLFEKSWKEIKGNTESFLEYFDIMQEEMIERFVEYRQNVAKFVENVARFNYDEVDNCSSQVLQFVSSTKTFTKNVSDSHRGLLDSIQDMRNKMEISNQLTTVFHENIHFLEKKWWNGTISVCTFNVLSNKIEHSVDIKVNNSINIIYKNNVYLIGGKNDGGEYQKSVEVYNLDTKNRKKLAEMQFPRYNATVGVHQGKLIVYGGWKAENLVKSVEEYDIENDKWKSIGEIEKIDSHPILVSFNGDLYVIGKNWSDAKCIIIEKYNKNSLKFQEISRRESEIFVDGCEYNGKICLVTQQAITSYNPMTGEWSKEAAFVKEKFGSIKLHSINNSIYAFDGETMEVFDQLTNSWNLIFEKGKND